MRFDRARGCFEAIVPLPQGQYRYQVVIDGRSRIDPYNESTITGETGSSTNCFTLAPAP